MAVHIRKHHKETCPICDENLWYGAVEEPASWKIFYVCHGEDGCRREWYAGRVARQYIDSLDEVFTEAESLSPID